MQSAFEALGISPALVITKDELNAAFRDAGKSAHPDAGGQDGEFAELQKSYDLLMSPSKRLRHWLELKGVEVNSRGEIDTAMMDLFASIGQATQQAEAHLRKRQETKSALGMAMLEGEAHVCRELVEQANEQIESAIANECDGLGEIEQTDPVDEEFAAKRMRNLVFLEKWQATMRSLFSRLL